METDERGNAYENDNQIHVDFSLNASNRYYSSSNKFANAYYYDELKAKGLDADYQYRWKEEKRNPRYYEEENKVSRIFRFQ